MKIAIVSSGEEKNGVGVYAKKLFFELKKSGKNISFETILPHKNPLYYYSMGKSIAEKNYDLINVQFDYQFFGKFGISGVYAPLFYFGLGTKTPIVTTMHDFTFFKGLKGVIFNTARRIINKSIFHYSSKVIVPDNYSKQRIIQLGANKEKLEKIPLGTFFNKVEIKGAKKLLGLEGKKIISIFGFVSKHKDYETVFKTVKKLGKEYSLIIAGGSMTGDTSFMDELKAKIKNEEIEEQVTITGFIPEKNFPIYLSATDICILPYKSMVASSAVLNQLMSFEKIVLTTKLPGLTEIEKNYDCIKSYSNEEDLTNIILNINLRKNKLKKGVLHYKKEFSFKNICGKYNNLFSRLKTGKK